MALELLSFAPTSASAPALQRSDCELMQRASHHHQYVEGTKSSSVLSTPASNNHIEIQVLEHMLQILINSQAFQQFSHTLSKSSGVATQIPVLTCEVGGGYTSACFPCQLYHHTGGIITNTGGHLDDCSQSGFNPHGLRYRSGHAISLKHHAERQSANAKLLGRDSQVGGDATATLTTSTTNRGHKCDNFPCPHGHHSSRGTISADSNKYKDSYQNGCSKNIRKREAKHILLERTASSSGAAEEHLHSRRSRSSKAELTGDGDGGHKCPGFPCPYCHRTRRILIESID